MAHSNIVEVIAVGKMSRDKGARFEREVCQLFSAWWGAEFQRTPQSGGSRLKDGWDLGGDVACAEEGFPFHVECKHVEGWDLSHLLTCKDMGLFGKWLSQACEECPDDQIPLVVFKKNRHPVMCMFLVNGLSDIERDISNNHAGVLLEADYFDQHRKRWVALCIMQWKDFARFEPAIFERPWV